MLAPRHSTGHLEAPEGRQAKRTKRGEARPRKEERRPDTGEESVPPLLLHHFCSGFLSFFRIGNQ